MEASTGQKTEPREERGDVRSGKKKRSARLEQCVAERQDLPWVVNVLDDFEHHHHVDGALVALEECRPRSGRGQVELLVDVAEGLMVRGRLEVQSDHVVTGIGQARG